MTVDMRRGSRAHLGVVFGYLGVEVADHLLLARRLRWNRGVASVRSKSSDERVTVTAVAVDEGDDAAHGCCCKVCHHPLLVDGAR